MSDRASVPLIGVTACLRPSEDGTGLHQVVGKYVDAVVQATGGVPVLIPTIGPAADPDLLVERLDGLLLTGSPSNVWPENYGGCAPRPDNLADRERDATTLPLIRKAVAQGLPLFAICRGIQELNVALGGSLHQHVHEVPGRTDHRSQKDRPQPMRYGPRHPVALTPGGMLQQILGGAQEIQVNSLHGQCIDRLAEGLRIEAVAPDGTPEAVSLPGAPGFVLGVQWHPEWRVMENPDSVRMFGAFADACRARAQNKVEHVRYRRVA
ncbi:MAG TPA: gamma-glutamyl-gamma-aminobutyrate hydrolase family protein [Geminicoccus sp.]|jgi:putative glutamine amidotransferase|uniref:gamma-glutamyl-gamma-aminobutyrate hydrolase family protein n=1 Tax=Geminicoccus sp. TaxID=2024832 RepID=UPI002E324E65|nr:gamma-glutamyl-gamma-aminobutyrate hydrolase family protein [Geminicoccus sp.]HEX2525029.1 gamma-glutamyl-gamma-aminobutyrate hydrolase family protein [Geminicoccus sp.]